MKLYDVFLSYRRSDGLEIAQSLYRHLTSKGLRVFYDKEEMIDGHYFSTQIENHLRCAPNYILIATDDVFRFREETDWVLREMEIAVETYEQTPSERTLTVIMPHSCQFPEEKNLPNSVRNIAKAQRIILPQHEPYTQQFQQALKAVTQVNRQNLWHAAHRWLENSRKPGGRFANLSISENILPTASANISRLDIPVKVASISANDVTQQEVKPLFDAISETTEHLYLIGQGGIGKTTALMHIMNHAYKNRVYTSDVQIPIFVELSFAPDTYGTVYETGISSFIRRSIYKQIRADRTIKQVGYRQVEEIDEVFLLPREVAVNPITDILSKTTNAPEYLLLLDGLNEVSSTVVEETGLSVAQMVMQEIELLTTQCPNVRVVLTSRSDDLSIRGFSVRRYYLSGIDPTMIRSYLADCKFSPESIDKALADPFLAETLKIPLFLCIYACLSDQNEANSQGEIFRLFFNEKRKYVDVYTVQDRLEQVEYDVSHAAGAVQKKRVSSAMQNFILDFILPEIAWKMEKDGAFYLRAREIRKIIEPVLTDTSDLSVCGEYGQELFCKYRNGTAANVHTTKIAKQILTRLGSDMMEITESIINCGIFALGILQESHSKYGFVHQHIRDYFAAVRNINTLRLSVYLYSEDEPDLALACMERSFRDAPVSFSVCRFMGEALGEARNTPSLAMGRWHSNVPKEDCDRTLITQALNIYRDRNCESSYALFSLTKVLAEVRTYLAGTDLSHLDLRSCRLNAAGLGLPGLSAKLDQARLQPENIFFSGHTQSVHSLEYHPDGSKILTVSYDGSAKLWDSKSGELIAACKQDGDLKFGCFQKDGSHILLVSCQIPQPQNYRITIYIWDPYNRSSIQETTYAAPGPIYNVTCSSDRRNLLFSNSEQVWVISPDGIRMILNIPTNDQDRIHFADFLQDDQVIVSFYNQSRSIGIAKLIDLKTCETLPLPEVFCRKVYAVSISSDGRYSVLLNQDLTDAHTIYACQEFGAAYNTPLNTFSLPEKLNNWICESYCMKYSPNGAYLAILLCGKVLVYETRNFHLVHMFDKPGYYDIAFHPNGNQIALSTYNGEVVLCSLRDFTPSLIIPGAFPTVCDFCFSPDGSLIATYSRDHRLRIWDSKTYRLLNETSIAQTSWGHVEFSPDGQTLAVSFYESSFFFRIPELILLKTLPGRCRFSPDGKYIVSQIIHSCTVFRAADHSTIFTVPYASLCSFMQGQILLNRISETSVMYAAHCPTLYLEVYDIESGKRNAQLKFNEVKQIYASDTSKDYIAASLDGNRICIWDTKTLHPIRQYSTLHPETGFLKFSTDGKLLFEGADGDLTIRETSQWNVIHSSIKSSADYMYCFQGTMESSPAGNWFIEKYVDFPKHDYILLYNSASLEQLYAWEVTLRSGERNYAFSPDDSVLLLCTEDDKLQLFQMITSETSESSNRIEHIGTIPIVPGVEVIGLDLRKLHPDCRFTNEQKDILRMYGAIID